MKKEYIPVALRPETQEKLALGAIAEGLTISKYLEKALKSHEEYLIAYNAMESTNSTAIRRAILQDFLNNNIPNKSYQINII